MSEHAVVCRDFYPRPARGYPLLLGVLWYDLCANTINHKEVYMSDNYPFEGYRYPERQDRPSPDSQVPYRPTERQPEPEPKK